MLSESLIGKIAAGEVVERPVSALKELIENSLDAGATMITAEIREGGLSYIRVSDNGCGIDESDIRLAFERHATSKISDEPDLVSIRTLGFRGEALASISAVSRVSMTTRTASRETGLKVVNTGGRIQKIEETACTIGTSIVVTDLFYNTPVRKGFMKKPSVEAGAVHDLIAQFILSRPDVAFHYICDGRTMLHSPGDGRLSSSALTVFGAKAMQTMRKVSGHENGILLKGFVGIGEMARGNRGQEYFFINKRMMHSAVLSNALETASRERVMIGKYPVCALHIQIPFEAVDVNVHPNKLEVRFLDERAVGEAVTSIVLEALKETNAFEKPLEMSLSEGEKTGMAARPAMEEIREGLKKNTGIVTITESLPPPEIRIPSEAVPSNEIMRESIMDLKPFTRPLEKIDESKTNETAGLLQPVPSSLKTAERTEQINTILPAITKPIKIFGALFNTYILVEYENQLLMVDQHAVHERLLFDKLMQEQSAQNTGQELLVPMIISLSERELALIEDNQALLESIGLRIERFGEHDAAVRTIPVVLGEAASESFVREAIADVERSGTLSFEKKRADLLQTACKHAVKGGEVLGEDQLRSLLDEMIEKKVTPTCPHGRPLVVAVTRREIDKKFKRIQE